MFSKLKVELICVCALLLLTGSCGIIPAKKDKHKSKSEKVDRHWIDRVAVKLRMGAGIGPEDDIAALESMSKSEIVDHLMADPRFIDTVFDFSLYFLGMKSDAKKHAEGTFNSIYFGSLGDVSPAITAAQEVAKNGDFLKLLDYKQQQYAFPLLRWTYKFEDNELKLVEIDREAAKSEFFNDLFELQSLITNDPTMPKDKFCEALDDANIVYNQISQPYGNQAMPSFDFMVDTCYGKKEEGEKLSEAEIQSLFGLTGAFQKFFAYVEQFAPPYEIKSVLDYKTVDPSQFGSYYESERVTGSWLWNSLPNSSTNKNRRRASYILKRYFCDDLTPLNVEQPKIHAADRHASDPSCQSCHYKLDPIAGFFKNHGGRGYKFVNLDKNIFFDDGAGTPLKDYVREWRDEDTGEWNIGYVRSTTDKSLNVYASKNPNDPQMEDLFAIIKDAPEVRQCLVKRAFEYVNGKDLSLDGSYLRHLADQFTELSKENSSTALRATVKDLLLSKSFAADDAESGICYDFAPGVDAKHRPPCEIADVIERHCVSCHGANGARGGLNLQSWGKNPEKFGFEHKDATGNDIPVKDSFASILGRLNDPNPKTRMPLDAYMSSQERQKLYLWLNASLEVLNKP
jgi:hypothetical protein